MNKLLKILFWILISILTSWTLVSCEETTAQPQTWYLDFATPHFSVSNLPAASIRENRDANRQKIGLWLTFTSERFTGSLWTYGVDSVYQFTGSIDGQAFLLYNDSINICNGEQRVPVTYSLKLK